MRKRFKIKNLIRNNRYTFLSKGKEALCPPLEGGPKSSISRRGTQAKRAFIIRAILGGGWTSPLLHSGCPLQPNMLRSVIPQQFRCITEGGGALRVDTVHFYTLDIRENPTCLSTSSRNRNKCIQRAAPPCGISKENWCIKRCTLQILVPRGED